MRPVSRLKVGQLLSTQGLATSAIDLSDGLAGDLSRLCEQSGVGAELDATMIPCSAALRAYSARTGQDAIELALQGGEDYELLFTVRHRHATRLIRLKPRLDCRLSCIGVITPKRNGLRLRGREGKVGTLVVQGYEHFRLSNGSRMQ
jgi:thiamine-monophosphate kinase